MRQIFYDDNLQRDMARDGYIVTRLLDGDEAAQLLVGMKELVSRQHYTTGGASDYLTPFNLSAASGDVAYKRSVVELVEREIAPRLQRLLVNYRLWWQSFFIKPAGSPELDVHCDWTLTDNPQDFALNLWCPLVDVDATNGALQVLKGSHKLLPNIVCPQSPRYFDAYTETVKPLTTAFALKAGEAIIFENSILHWSPPNTTDADRFVIASLCLPEESRPAIYYPAETAAGPGFTMYGLDDETFITHPLSDFGNGSLQAPRSARLHPPLRRPLRRDLHTSGSSPSIWISW